MSALANEAADKTIAAMRASIDRMAASVPKPELINRAGNAHYRYREKDPRQALVLKLVRMLSALLSLRTLINAGLALDAGAVMRIMDELGSDIQFLAGPIIYQTAPEKNHERYLKEFFQEEFDHSNPLKSTQKRDRVSRRDIRAYVARTYQGEMNVSDIVSVTETVEQAFSGFIHGAMCHTMDAYDGRRFHIPMRPDDDPIEALTEQFSQYAHRALMSATLVAKALSDEALFAKLHTLQAELFDEWGDYRPQA